MSHVMGDIPIKLNKTSSSAKDEDDENVLTQEQEQLYEDGKRKNEVLPLFYGGDAEVMIHTVQEFDEVADDLEFTEAHEKFTNFRKCLYDVACDDWDTVKVRQVNTIAEDLSEMASYLPEFPKPMAATDLSDIDLKNIIFRGTPTVWQESFVHANMRIVSVTLALMTDYLASEQVIADARRDKNNKGRGSQGGRSSITSRGFTPGPHGATCRGRGGFCGGRGNGGDQNDTYQNDAASNAGSNNRASPNAASTVTNAGSRSSGWVDRTNASVWGSGNQSASNTAANNH
eukprot:scaffold26612_cov56-Attheya_sp.AAC.3